MNSRWKLLFVEGEQNFAERLNCCGPLIYGLMIALEEQNRGDLLNPS